MDIRLQWRIEQTFSASLNTKKGHSHLDKQYKQGRSAIISIANPVSISKYSKMKVMMTLKKKAMIHSVHEVTQDTFSCRPMKQLERA